MALNLTAHRLIETASGFVSNVSSNTAVSGTYTLPCNNAEYNSGDYSTSTYEFTAPFEGIYQFRHLVWMSGTVTYYAYIRTDNTTDYASGAELGRRGSGSGTWSVPSLGACVLYLNAGDKAWAEVALTGSGTVLGGSSGDNRSVWSGVMLQRIS